MKYKEIRANGKGSFKDFKLAIKSRNISLPEKKKIKNSVPFQNGTYDFSDMNGEIYWEERILEYVFDIAEFSTEEMEQIKDKVVDWLLNIHDTDIEDDYTADYYYHGSYDTNSWNEDFGQGELTVRFSVYPYKYAKERTIITQEISETETSIIINNESSHRIMPIVTINGDVSITIGKNTYALTSGTYTDSNLILEKGENTWNVIATSETANLDISYRKEVF